MWVDSGRCEWVCVVGAWWSMVLAGGERLKAGGEWERKEGEGQLRVGCVKARARKRTITDNVTDL